MSALGTAEFSAAVRGMIFLVFPCRKQVTITSFAGGTSFLVSIFFGS